jgi:uncharacterized Fe-S cluster-containing radical SAM superfamily protein
MKVLLLQLPIQTHDFFFSNENIPLAPAYLQVTASEQGVTADLLPSHLMRYGSDQAILEFIVNAQPDLVGMSCYLWNIERSLFLAEGIKRDLPGCRIVLGGPEITPENDFLLPFKSFDVGVVGEGEDRWRGLLQSFPRIPKLPGLLLPGKGRAVRSSGNEIGRGVRLGGPSPYLRGILDSHLQGVLWIETVRGCVYRCAYCYYHKQSPRLRTFSVERVLQEVKRAWEQGLKEIIFLDPCFIRRPSLESLLDGIAVINRDRRLKLHAESTVEGVDAALARKMARAGFIKIEAGLQSVNQKTLRHIHRSFHPQKFLDGIRCLQEHGVEVMVDLIAGLPGDRLPDIHRSLDWVLEREAYDYLMLYPLSLMASTELKQRAEALGLVAMPHPPYLLTGGPGLTAQEMCRAFDYYEERMEEDISPLEMPIALDPKAEASNHLKGLIHSVSWRMGDAGKSLLQIGDRTTYALTISMTRKVLRQPESWVQYLENYLGRNPFSLLSVEVPFDVEPVDLDPLWQLARGHRHPGDRDYTVTHTPYRSFFLFSREKGLIWKWPDPRESLPLELHDGQKVDCSPVCLVIAPQGTIPQWFQEHMQQRYKKPPEIRLWVPPES